MIRRVVLGAIGALGVLAGVTTASASEGPSITLDRVEVAPGDPVIVSLRGFRGQVATVAVCGNLARRGSADCNMPTAQAERIRHDDPLTFTQLLVQPPPVPCPCLVRASTTANEEFAVASLVVLGHPVAPVVDSEQGPLVDVAIESRRISGGVVASLRSWLGGPTRYDVTVSVRNRTTGVLSNVALAGGARSGLDDEAASLHLERPGQIEPGQTWTQSLEVEVPAPVLGGLTWWARASGAGESVAAGVTTSHIPWLFLVLLALLAGDLTAIGVRFVSRRRRVVGDPEIAADRSSTVHPAADPAKGPLPTVPRRA